jgi:hypothetical protein
MYKLDIDISDAQMKRLHKGRKVRVKKGKGFELMVHPMTYNIVSRAFDKGKGSQIQLSPEEISMNKNGMSPVGDMSGMGVGDITVGDMYNTAKYGANKVIDAGVYAGEAYQNYRDKKGKGVGRSAPEQSTEVFIPERNLKFPPRKITLGDVQSHIHLANDLNKQLGTNYAYLARAGMDNALANKESAALAKMGIDARYREAPVMTMNSTQGPPSRAVGGQLERSSVGRNGGMISSFYPPALVSQPFSANFQFQHFLPPQYQHFNMGGHYDENDVSGNGLYA